MADRRSVEGLGLAEAIQALRDDLLKARAAGATSDIQLPVESMTVELTITATRDGRWQGGVQGSHRGGGAGWGWEPGARHRAEGDGGVRRAGGS